ncbi:hypothetical protein SY83_05510 [Paenibacillus swuensis]|uniref:Uncharacterized protein n=1 Tax=Paenibacillus swuensis TaxID=1178515 RepID=A0A172TFN5_9BACL|nr:hypothetical protein [Paenibacillus swuensis]ANE45851.1 hypothetical protein SY83_05510 [Paenibacillus swuensis]
MITKLSNERFEKAKSYIKEHGRTLDQSRLDYYLHHGSKENVLNVLRTHQNLDGGFQDMGEGPRNFSSPIGTSVAFQLLTDLDVPVNDPMVQNGLKYIVETFDHDLGLWQPAFNWLHEEVNLVQSWGNPSAELVGYLNHYKEIVSNTFLDKLLNITARNMLLVKRPMDTFVLLCYMRLVKFAPDGLKELIIQRLQEDVPKVIETDPAKWSKWCTKPYWFAISSTSPVADIINQDVIRNLEYEIQNQTDEGFFPPHWNDTEENLWNWKSILTIDVLKALRNYNMIDQ